MKEKRKIIYNKYNGHCYLCGCVLNGKFHIDELLPVKRNYKWNKDKTKYIHDGTYQHPENLNHDNQMPSCPSCNINKHSLDLEDFRKLIEGFMKHLNEISTQYKIAKRYGLIFENIQPVVFYFERTLTERDQVKKNKEYYERELKLIIYHSLSKELKMIGINIKEIISSNGIQEIFFT